MRSILCTIILLLFSTPVRTVPAAELHPIAILESKANFDALKVAGVDHARGVAWWTALADDLGLPFRVMDDAALAEGVGDASILIVIGAPSLTDAQVDAIQVFNTAGGAVLLVGMPGQLHADGTPRETPPAISLAGITDPVSFEPEDEGAANFTLRLSSPLGLVVEPALRLEVANAGLLWAATLAEPAGYWVDWSMMPLLGDPPLLNASAAVALTEGTGGRVAWLGAPPEAITEVNDQNVSARRMSLQLLRWLLRKPWVHKGWWPLGLRAATVLTADVETYFETGEAIALMLHREAVRGSFFLLGDLAKEYPYVVEALAENGDVGSHSMHHKSFKGRTGDDQRAEIQEAIADLHGLGIRHVEGFRPPKEEFDISTLQVVAEEGLGFIYGNLAYDRAWPIRRTVGELHLWQFARIVPDDYNLAVHYGANTAATYTADFMEWGQRIFDLGGLYPFSFHTNYLGLEKYVETIGRFIRWVKHQRIWIATFSDIVRWVEARELVDLTVREHPATMEVTLTNRGTETVASFPLVYLGTTNGAPVILTETDGIVLRAREDFGHLILVDLAPGDSRTIIIKDR